MKVSVVLPVYNGQEHLEQTIESVLNQTRPCSELIAVDDGSTDSSLEILKSYTPRVTVLSQANQGVSAARNRGAERAKGDLLAFVDQDDIWYPHKNQRQMDLFLEKGTEPFIYSDLDLIDRTGKQIRPAALASLRATWMQPFIGGHLHPYPSTVLMRRDLYMEVGGFDPAFRENGHEDVDLWVRLYGKVPFEFIPEALIQYRADHTHRKKKKRRFEVNAANFLYLYEKLEKNFSGDPSKKEPLDMLLSVVHANKAKALLFEGNPREARVHFRQAHQLYPGNKRNFWRYYRTYLPAFLHKHIFSS